MDAATDEIERLNSRAWESRVSDSSLSYRLSQKAIILAEKTGYRKGLAEGLRTYAFAHIRLSKNEDALKILNDAEQIFSELQNERGLSDIYEYYGIIYRSLGNYKSSLDFLYKSLDLRRHNGYLDGEGLSYYHLGVTYKYLGNQEQALDYFLNSMKIGLDIKDWVSISYSQNNIGLIYMDNQDYINALDYFNQSLEIRRESGDKWGQAGCYDNIGFCYFKLKQLDEAVLYCTRGLEIVKVTGDKKGEANAYFHLGNIYSESADGERAMKYYEDSLKIRKEIGDKKGQAEVLLFMIQHLLEKSAAPGNDKIQTLVTEARILGEETQAADLLSKIQYVSFLISRHLEDFKNALLYLEKHLQLENEIHNKAITQKIHHLEILHKTEKERKEAIELKKRNEELAELYQEIKSQKEEIEFQKKGLEQTLGQLRSTQTQLIHKEKMASLGELTAGIAHELQNPLNFVVNFSSLNEELSGELISNIHAGHYSDSMEIAGTIQDNSQKILLHGKRAEMIIRSMMQHAVVNHSVKENREINSFILEYYWLSYHNFRSKNESFQADFVMMPQTGEISCHIIPPDIGKVLINLFNNAFYAMHSKKLTNPGNYSPQLTVFTRGVESGVELAIHDNGTGIPDSVTDKIFQPFFTTKPAGLGTGLGLSISYDIITKGHGGELKVISEEGIGTEFVIILPRK